MMIKKTQSKLTFLNLLFVDRMSHLSIHAAKYLLETLEPSETPYLHEGRGGDTAQKTLLLQGLI